MRGNGEAVDLGEREEGGETAVRLLYMKEESTNYFKDTDKKNYNLI